MLKALLLTLALAGLQVAKSQPMPAPLPPIQPPQSSDPLETMRRVQEIRNLQMQAERQRLEAERLRMENQARATPQPSAAASAPAIDPNDSRFKSSGLYNGRWWNSLDALVKPIWVETYANGVIFATSVLGTTDKIRLVMPVQLTYGEISKALDTFYVTPENAPIPIASALQVVDMKAAGLDQAVIDNQVNLLRRAGFTQ